MDCVHWHTGCISARSHGKACAEIHLVHGQCVSVQVYVPPVWLGHLPSGIYRVTTASGPVTVAPRGQAPCLPGWLAYPHSFPCTNQNSCSFGALCAAAPGLGNKFVARPEIRFHQHAVQHMRLHRSTSTKNAGQNPKHFGSLEVSSERHCERPSHTLGHVGFYGHSNAKKTVYLRPIQWRAS